MERVFLYLMQFLRRGFEALGGPKLSPATHVSRPTPPLTPVAHIRLTPPYISPEFGTSQSATHFIHPLLRSQYFSHPRLIRPLLELRQNCGLSTHALPSIAPAFQLPAKVRPLSTNLDDTQQPIPRHGTAPAPLTCPNSCKHNLPPSPTFLQPPSHKPPAFGYALSLDTIRDLTTPPNRR